MEGRSRKGKVEVVIMRKNCRYEIVTAQKIFEVFIVKWVVKVRILGNASFMAFLPYWIHLFFNFFCLTDTAIFPYTILYSYLNLLLKI